MMQSLRVKKVIRSISCKLLHLIQDYSKVECMTKMSHFEITKRKVSGSRSDGIKKKKERKKCVRSLGNMGKRKGENGARGRRE